MTNLINDLYDEAIQKVNDLNLKKGRRVVRMLQGHQEMLPAEIEAEDINFFFNRAKSNITSCFEDGSNYFESDEQIKNLINELF